MLRVGLTGGLGSGKSTVAAMLRAHGAQVLEADAIGREMMRPGFAVYDAIVSRFGDSVVGPGGELDRSALARIAFGDGRVEELNAIVHPAVIAEQARLARGIGQRDPRAIVIVESALLFETKYGGPAGWRDRFDRVILVTAEEAVRVLRFVHRVSGTEAEARRRIEMQIPDAEKLKDVDFVLRNDAGMKELEHQVASVWVKLKAEAEGRIGVAP